jgi:uncharacterized protein
MKSILGPPLQFDWKTVTVTILSALLLMVDYYHRLTPDKGLDRTILYLAVPMVCIVLVFREDPREYGFALGDWKAGLLIVALSIALMSPLLWLVGRGQAMQVYYQSQVTGLPWNTFIDLCGWEFFFRGFILFAYVRKFGHDALWLQALPFALAHIGKPEVEALSTIFGGFAFGWIAFRTRSFIYPFLIHWFVTSFTILLAAGLLG